MKRLAVIVCLCLAMAGLFWFFPLFHIERLDARESARRQASFDAARFAREFWDSQLIPSMDRASIARDVVEAIHDEPYSVRDKFGRSPGLGRAYYCFLRGTGTVVSVDRKGIGLSLDKTGDTHVVLLTGMLFGNSVRDATGLLDAGEFANSQDFNDVSTELNRIAATEVAAPLIEQVVVGNTLHFVGCAEIRNAVRDLKPLRLVAVKASVE